MSWKPRKHERTDPREGEKERNKKKNKTKKQNNQNKTWERERAEKINKFTLFTLQYPHSPLFGTSVRRFVNAAIWLPSGRHGDQKSCAWLQGLWQRDQRHTMFDMMMMLMMMTMMMGFVIFTATCNHTVTITITVMNCWQRTVRWLRSKQL